MKRLGHRLVGVVVIGVGSLTVLWSSNASAGEPRQHDSGFFLRLSGGGGAGQTKWKEEVSEIGPGEIEFKLSGPAGDLNLAIGKVISPNVAVHASLFGWTASNPDLEVEGESFETDATTLDMTAIGAGVTYYLNQSNVYLSGSVGAATLSLEVDNTSQETDTGIALDLTIGKEWWVSENWGIGLAGDVNYHSIPSGDEAISGNLSGTSFGLRFSATMN